MSTRKAFTNLLFLVCFVFPSSSWSETWEGMNMIHIEDHGEQALVLRKTEDVFISKPELENLIEELESYIRLNKHDKKPITKEDIEDFFKEKGYVMTMVGTDNPYYLKLEENGDTIVYLIASAILGVIAVVGVIILVNPVAAGATSLVLFTTKMTVEVSLAGALTSLGIYTNSRNYYQYQIGFQDKIMELMELMELINQAIRD